MIWSSVKVFPSISNDDCIKAPLIGLLPLDVVNLSFLNIWEFLVGKEKSSFVEHKKSFGKKVGAHTERKKVVHNLSSRDLNSDELSLVSKGLSFCPNPRNINKAEIANVTFEKFGSNRKL